MKTFTEFVEEIDSKSKKKKQEPAKDCDQTAIDSNLDNVSQKLAPLGKESVQ